jgi:hypothetical protein
MQKTKKVCHYSIKRERVGAWLTITQQALDELKKENKERVEEVHQLKTKSNQTEEVYHFAFIHCTLDHLLIAEPM